MRRRSSLIGCTSCATGAITQHLIKTVTAARLMVIDCIISGIRPQIAQINVHLGVDLSNIVTKAIMADAFCVALARTGHGVLRRSANPTAPTVS